MKNKAGFAHLYKHVRLHRQSLTKALATSKINQQTVTMEVGALDCLYWQAMGMGELVLATHIRRQVAKSLKLHRIPAPCIAHSLVGHRMPKAA